MTYEYYDENPVADTAYDYEADDHTHDNSTTDVTDEVAAADEVTIVDETKKDIPKRSRRQVPIAHGDPAPGKKLAHFLENFIKIIIF